jgi:hypothetical protein
VVETAGAESAKNSELVAQFVKVVTTAENLQRNVDGRLQWLEVLKAIDAALPKDPRPPEKRQETEEDIAKREELHIEQIECEYFADLTNWQNSVRQHYTPAAKPSTTPAAGDAAAPNAAAAPGQTPPGTPPPSADPTNPTPPTDPNNPPPAADPTASSTTDPAAQAADTSAAPPANSGWVIEIRGYHLHNKLPNAQFADEGEEFLKNTFLKQLELGTVKLPDGPHGELVDVPIADLGIKYPVVVTHPRIRNVTYSSETPDNMTSGGSIYRPGSPEMPGGVGPGGALPAADQPKQFKLRKYPFLVQFMWQPQPRGQRLERMAQKKAAATPSTAAAEASPTTTGPSS